jgi:hypothetical protein
MLNLPNNDHVIVNYCHPTDSLYFFTSFNILSFIIYLIFRRNFSSPRMILALFYPLMFFVFLRHG